MAQNNGHLLALFDELSFLTKLKLCSSKGLSDSHEFYAFLELYNANEWTRSTGMFTVYMYSVHMYVHNVHVHVCHPAHATVQQHINL